MEKCGSCKKQFLCLFPNSRRGMSQLVICPFCHDPTKLLCTKLELSSTVYINCLECHALTKIIPEFIEYPTIECALCLIPLTRDPLPIAFQKFGALDMVESSLSKFNFGLMSKQNTKQRQKQKIKELKELHLEDFKEEKEGKKFEPSNQKIGIAKTRREKMRESRKAVIPMHKENSYIIWQKEIRPTINKTGKSSQDIARELGLLWKNLTPEEKTKYKEMSNNAPVKEIKKRKIPKMPSGVKLKIVEALKSAGPEANSDEIALKLGVKSRQVRAIKGNFLNGLYASVVDDNKIL